MHHMLLIKGKSHWGEMPKRSPNWFRRVVESMPQTQYRAKRKKKVHPESGLKIIKTTFKNKQSQVKLYLCVCR